MTRFVKRESARAAAQGDDPRARAVGFLMSLYQRRLASSTYAMRRSLENRARRLEEGLKRAQELARPAPPDLPDPEELEEMEESERERLEAHARGGHACRERRPGARTRSPNCSASPSRPQAVEDAGAEAKLSQLKELLQKEGFFDHPDQRLLLFTEFKDTLDYLVADSSRWGFRVGCIHGGMKSGSRDEPGTRLVGAEIKTQVEQALADSYVADRDGSKPIAYLWARTVRCEAPNCGAEIPLARSFMLSKRRNLALRPQAVRSIGEPPWVEFELFEPKASSDVPRATVSRAKATCVACGVVLAPERVRVQLRAQHGGADVVFDGQGRRAGGARMLAVVGLKAGERGRQYRLPNDRDYEAVRKAQAKVVKILDAGARRQARSPPSTL